MGGFRSVGYGGIYRTHKRHAPQRGAYERALSPLHLEQDKRYRAFSTLLSSLQDSVLQKVGTSDINAMEVQEVKALNDRLDRIEQLTLLGVKSVLDIHEVALLTGFTVAHLYQLTSRREIPHYKKGKKLYFNKEEVERWMTSKKVLTNQEIESKATTHVAIHKRAY